MIERPIIVFGSGGFAKEILGYLGNADVLCVVSTVDFNNPLYSEKYAVLPKVPDGLPQDTGFLMCVSDPSLKRKFVEENEDRWISYIHETCTISPFTTIGRGSVLGPQCIVAGDAQVSTFVTMNTNATIGHDSSVGMFSTMYPNSEICGNCIVGHGCMLGIGSYVLPNVYLPATTRVSAGAVVRKSVESPVTLYGDPAKPRRKAA